MLNSGVIHRSEARAELGLPEWPGIDDEPMPGGGDGDRGGDSDSGKDTGVVDETTTDTDM